MNKSLETDLLSVLWEIEIKSVLPVKQKSEKGNQKIKSNSSIMYAMFNLSFSNFGFNLLKFRTNRKFSFSALPSKYLPNLEKDAFVLIETVFSRVKRFCP